MRVVRMKWVRARKHLERRSAQDVELLLSFQHFLMAAENPTAWLPPNLFNPAPLMDI